MKTLTAITAVGLLTFGMASSAWAYRFSPADTTFKANGSTTVVQGPHTLNCTSLLSLSTVGNAAQIDSATFSGTNCKGLTASGLPWRLTVAGTAHSGNIHGMALSASNIGLCGPDEVPFQLASNGKITMTSSRLGSCSVSATYATKPNLTIIGH